MNANEKALVEMFARSVAQAGGKALLVGGIVRDEILGLPSKDVDFEVFGLPMEQVHTILKQFGNVKDVGKQFGVLNIQELDWDVALPRREMKTGEGHKGFDIVPDPTMSVEEAARRRDLTINALSKDPLTGQIIDPLGGTRDLKDGILRAADPNTFSDDPLRALRVAQFAARFNFEVAPATLTLVAAQPLEELPGERILPEFSKMLLKGQKPSKGIEVLNKAGLLRYFPEIAHLQGIPQSPEHHPEGDVYEHTLLVIDEAAKQRTGDPAFDLPLMLSALAHDFGKPDNTQIEDDAIRSLGHEEGGVEPTVSFLRRMKAPQALVKQVSALVATHLRPVTMPGTSGRKGYRRLRRTLDAAGVSPELLAALSKADTLGRTTPKAISRDTAVQDAFVSEMESHTGEQGSVGMQDAVSGKDLISRGMKPGPGMGKFLGVTRAIQDDTGINDVNQLIDLATKFLGQEEKGLKCGDGNIRPGEECYDGEYREMRKRGKTKSSADCAVGRPCGEDEEYPDKCVGPNSNQNSAEMTPEEKATKKARFKEVTQLIRPLAEKGKLTQEEFAQFETLGMERDSLLLDFEKPATPADVAPPSETKSTLSPDVVASARNEMRENRDIASAMLSAVRGVGFDADTQVDTIMRGKNPKVSPNDLYNQFTGTRELLRAQYGDNLTLYRAETGKQRQKPTKNWATTPQFASQFDGQVVEHTIPVSKVAAVMVTKNGKYHELLVLSSEYEDESEATGAQGPSAFRTNPDPDQADYILWKKFPGPPGTKSGDTTQHPGLATTAEPQRRHERSLTYQPRWFDSGNKRSKRPASGPGSRDGFGGSLPYGKDTTPSIPLPSEPNWDSVTPEPGTPKKELPSTHHPAILAPGIPTKSSAAPNNHSLLLLAFDWSLGDIAVRPRNNKRKGFLPVTLPIPQIMDTSDPAPSPMRAGESGSSQPGKFVRKPGGGGLDRAPMRPPQGVVKPTGFLPVVNDPDPGNNMFKAALDSHVDQHELELGIQDELTKTHNEKKAKGVAKDNLVGDPHFYSKKPRTQLDSVSNKEKNQVTVGPSESVEGAPNFGRGGQDPSPDGDYMKHGKSKKGGPGGGDDKSREYWDMDRTGKKAGFLSIDLPRENVYPAETEAARTMEDLTDIDAIFPKERIPDWGEGNKPSMGPSMKHRNSRNVPPDPIKGGEEDGIQQKQAQELVPNQKLGVAIDPQGAPGNRVTIMQPLFTEVSPAIQSLRSQRFEDHMAVVLDGTPEWIMNFMPVLESLDRVGAAESAATLYSKILELAQQRGLTIEYTQQPQ